MHTRTHTWLLHTLTYNTHTHTQLTRAHTHTLTHTLTVQTRATQTHTRTTRIKTQAHTSAHLRLFVSQVSGMFHRHFIGSISNALPAASVHSQGRGYVTTANLNWATEPAYHVDPFHAS